MEEQQDRSSQHNVKAGSKSGRAATNLADLPLDTGQTYRCVNRLEGFVLAFDYYPKMRLITQYVISLAFSSIFQLRV